MNNNSPQISEKNTEHQASLWTMRDVARYIKCSVRTVCNLQKAGLPFMKIGHLTRYEPKVVMRWMGNDQAS